MHVSFVFGICVSYVSISPLLVITQKRDGKGKCTSKKDHLQKEKETVTYLMPFFIINDCTNL